MINLVVFDTLSNYLDMLCTDIAYGAYLKSICLSMRLAVATRGSLPVERECSSKLEEMIWVVISVSAAVPAPQQLDNNTIRQHSVRCATSQLHHIMLTNHIVPWSAYVQDFENLKADDWRPYGLLENYSTRHQKFFFVQCFTQCESWTNKVQHCLTLKLSTGHLLNVGGDVVDLGAVLVCHYHALSGSGISS